MNSKVLIALIIAVVFFIVAYSLLSGNNAYQEEISKIHQQKIDFLCMSPDSPVKSEIDRAKIGFFNPDKTYKVNAELIDISDIGRIEMATNDGSVRPYIKFAKAAFEIDGKKDTLTIFIEPTFNANYKKAFVPFRDESSGEETYGAGRYLDAEIKNDSDILLDFNLAYNPFCAYDPKFSCPLPPSSNYINFPVLAGEKNYK